MTYIHNTLDNMCRVGAAYTFSTPFVAGFKGDDGIVISEHRTRNRVAPGLKIEEGITGTFVGYLVGDVLTLDLPRLANKAACRTYTTEKQAHEYRVAIADQLALINNNDEAHHMITLNAYHYKLSREDMEVLWTYLVTFAQGSVAFDWHARTTKLTPVWSYKKIFS